jgi:hypothetical protein
MGPNALDYDSHYCYFSPLIKIIIIILTKKKNNNNNNNNQSINLPFCLLIIKLL